MNIRQSTELRDLIVDRVTNYIVAKASRTAQSKSKKNAESDLLKENNEATAAEVLINVLFAGLTLLTCIGPALSTARLLVGATKLLDTLEKGMSTISPLLTAGPAKSVIPDDAITKTVTSILKDIGVKENEALNLQIEIGQAVAAANGLPSRPPSYVALAVELYHLIQKESNELPNRYPRLLQFVSQSAETNLGVSDLIDLSMSFEAPLDQDILMKSLDSQTESLWINAKPTVYSNEYHYSNKTSGLTNPVMPTPNYSIYATELKPKGLRPSDLKEKIKREILEQDVNSREEE